MEKEEYTIDDLIDDMEHRFTVPNYDNPESEEWMKFQNNASMLYLLGLDNDIMLDLALICHNSDSILGCIKNPDMYFEGYEDSIDAKKDEAIKDHIEELLENLENLKKFSSDMKDLPTSTFQEIYDKYDKFIENGDFEKLLTSQLKTLRHTMEKKLDIISEEKAYFTQEPRFSSDVIKVASELYKLDNANYDEPDINMIDQGVRNKKSELLKGLQPGENYEKLKSMIYKCTDAMYDSRPYLQEQTGKGNMESKASNVK